VHQRAHVARSTTSSRRLAGVSRRNVVLLVVGALLVVGVQWGVRWVVAEDDPYRCQITVESWEAAGSDPYPHLPDDQRHIGAIYSGDSGCTPPERCYQPRVGLLTTTLEPCEGYTADS
jgi:hypothetical protein